VERRSSRKASAIGSTKHANKLGARDRRPDWARPAQRAAAENGVTINQFMALFGWKTEKMALLYTRKADRKRLSSTVAPLMLRLNDVTG
jgi:hypothetical protein